MTVTAANIHQGPGLLYYGCTVPDDQTLIELTAGVPNGGTDAGATDGEATIEIIAEFAPITCEQHTAPIDYYCNAEGMKITVNLKEATATLFVLFSTQSTAVTCTSPSQDGFFAGGLPTTTILEGIALVSPLRDGTGYKCTLMYKCNAVLGSWGYSKDKELIIPVTFTAAADITRTAGDQIGQHFEQTT